jgi:hypothetical protein
MLEFLLVAPLAWGIEGTKHLSEQLAVFGGILDIAAAAQDQLLLQPSFHMAVGCLNDPVFMSEAAVLTLLFMRTA